MKDIEEIKNLEIHFTSQIEEMHGKSYWSDGFESELKSENCF